MQSDQENSESQMTQNNSTKENFMRLVDVDVYQSETGFSARREEGLTPNGGQIYNRWVLRDKDNNFIDYDQFRHDLFERNGLNTQYGQVKFPRP